MKPGTLDRIVAHVHHAREKHPEWRKTPEYVLSVAEMEWHEFAHALSWEGRKRAEEEALDLIAVLVRYIEGDAERKKYCSRHCGKDAHHKSRNVGGEAYCPWLTGQLPASVRLHTLEG